jgi:predicted nucleic acid-binding protein
VARSALVIHLDTGFLIRALVPGSAEGVAMEDWLSGGEPLQVSAVAWTEFLCGPVLPAHVEVAESLFGRPVALDGPEAAQAAKLFVLGGRRRHSLADCMVAATAIEFEVERHPCLQIGPKPTLTWNAVTSTATLNVSLWNCGNVGLDVGWKWDTTGIVPLWIRDPEFRLFGPATVLTPPRDGNTLDIDDIKRAFVILHARNPIHTVVMDMSQAMDVAQWLETELHAAVIERKQTNPAKAQDYNAFMEALRNGWLHHSGDEGLTTHALNAIAKVLPYGDSIFERTHQNRISPDQPRRVIDALTAAAMVHWQATVAPEPLEEAPIFAWG